MIQGKSLNKNLNQISYHIDTKNNNPKSVQYVKFNQMILLRNSQVSCILQTPAIQIPIYVQDKNVKIRPERNTFSEEEDNFLISIVKRIGDNSWQVAADMMNKMNYIRNARQCKDRYFHYLDPKIKKYTLWTSAEDEILLSNVEKMGKRWKNMEKMLPGRTEVSIRNRYNVLIRKMSKKAKKVSSASDIMSDQFSFLDSLYIPKKKVAENVLPQKDQIIQNDFKDLSENSQLFPDIDTIFHEYNGEIQFDEYGSNDFSFSDDLIEPFL